ncbi:hypothetical protein KBY81_15140 [Cyanobium sp. Lug-B]|nr:hypothetical protein [Cyanobium sp. Lug-B]
MTTAPAPSKPTPRKVTAPKRPPMPLPTTAAELLSLDAAGLNAVFIEARLRLGKQRSTRARLLAAEKIDEQKVAVLKAEIAELGGLLCTIQTRRGHLRREARRALGRPIERNEAIASAVDSLLSGHLHAAVMAEADRLQKQALADLEAAPEAA